MDVQTMRTLCPPLEYFYQLTQIPHTSGDEKAMGQYLMDFASRHGLQGEMDGCGNVCIRKPGQGDGAQKRPLLLQSHMDMVYVQTPDASRQYGQPLDLVCEDGYLRAKDSSLGADNGMGVAYILALLAADETLSHPPLTAIFTVNEEDGLVGAIALEPGFLQGGERLLNLDGEEQQVLTAGCAGAIAGQVEKDLQRVAPSPDTSVLKLQIAGGLGGHSGFQIHLGRCNALIALSRLISGAQKAAPVAVEQFGGGSMMNVIPSSAAARIRVPKALVADCKAAIEEAFACIRTEYACQDPALVLTITEAEDTGSAVLADSCWQQLQALLELIFQGVYALDPQVKGLVQTSNNVGVCQMTEDKATLGFNLRSSLDSQKYFLSETIERLCQWTEARYTIRSDYPGWSYAPVSPLREHCAKTYEKRFGTSPRVEAVHAGLECGCFAKKHPGLDMVSIGPDILDVHSVKEHMSIQSAQDVWAWLQDIVTTMEA